MTRTETKQEPRLTNFLTSSQIIQRGKKNLRLILILTKLSLYLHSLSVIIENKSKLWCALLFAQYQWPLQQPDPENWLNINSYTSVFHCGFFSHLKLFITHSAYYSSIPFHQHVLSILPLAGYVKPWPK